jgi:superfamily II DNA or RNA helicase
MTQVAIEINEEYAVEHEADALAHSTGEEVSVDEMFGERAARWYQIAARNETVDAIINGEMRVLVKQPTGAGKTFTSGLIFSCPRLRAHFGLKEGEKLVILFVAHKHRLLTQAEREYADAEGIQLVVQSAFTKVPDDLFYHIVCLDEAHHEAMMTIQYQLDKLSMTPIIGLTATPERADGLLIKFSRIVEPISREQAVAEGFLAETELYSYVDAPERDKVEILKDIFAAHIEQMQQTMVFVSTKKEAFIITEYLRSLGKTAACVIKQSDRELDLLLDRFSAGEVQFIVNCNRISEGVDVRGCSDLVLGRTFGSYPMLNQVIGRAARPDSPCRVRELINPLSGRNLDTTVVVGEPKVHKLYYRVNGHWVGENFDYQNEWNPTENTIDEQNRASRQGSIRRR